MSELRIRETGELISEQDFRSASSTVYPTPLDEASMDAAGVDPVFVSPQPQAAYGQYVARAGVSKDAIGNWVEVWELRERDPDDVSRELIEVRRAKELEINAWRAMANLSHFPHAGKNVACDQLSRSDIDAVASHIALFGTFPVLFPGGWKTVENTYIPMPTVQDFKSMYAAMAKQGTANFKHSQDLKALVAAATTPDEVRSIRWSDNGQIGPAPSTQE